MNAPGFAGQLGLIRCPTCHLVCEDVDTSAPGTPLPPSCPRCGSTLHRRTPQSMSRAWAYLIAAMALYLPANVFPVMYTNLLGKSTDNTILGGIVDFWSAGSYGIAMLIFTASLAVPCGKFIALTWLLLTSRRNSRTAPKARAKLYRFVELVGYWSMLDVLVVAWATALAKFGTLSDAEPRIGILFFGGVVILTMLSALSFDPRSIWDNTVDVRPEQ